MDFTPFTKIARLSRECVITEKIDGTNASIYIPEDDGPMLIGSRTRWITPTDDNYGFARWAYEHEAGLRLLGPGQHFGEWWGQGIQRKYGLNQKQFSLFNVGRWRQEELDTLGIPCFVVPTLYTGAFDSRIVDTALADLAAYGSFAAPGFMNPEGIVIYHTASRTLFKKTIERDAEPKGKAA